MAVDILIREFSAVEPIVLPNGDRVLKFELEEQGINIVLPMSGDSYKQWVKVLQQKAVDVETFGPGDMPRGGRPNGN